MVYYNLNMKKKKLIYIVSGIFFLTILGLGLFFLFRQSTFVQPPGKPEVFPSPSPIKETENFSYRLGKCRQPGASNSISLSQVGNSIKFNQILNTYCNAPDALTITYALFEKNIEIREIFESRVVAKTVSRCVCSFEIEGQINNLAVGQYNIKFVFENRYTNHEEILEEKQFDLK